MVILSILAVLVLGGGYFFMLPDDDSKKIEEVKIEKVEEDKPVLDRDGNINDIMIIHKISHL